jgi:hypothetical protein
MATVVAPKAWLNKKVKCAPFVIEFAFQHFKKISKTFLLQFLTNFSNLPLI